MKNVRVKYCQRGQLNEGRLAALSHKTSPCYRPTPPVSTENRIPHCDPHTICCAMQYGKCSCTARAKSSQMRARSLLRAGGVSFFQTDRLLAPQCAKM